MLVSLHVKNIALIDESEIYFNEGLNILSGETGAGKSILLGSINLALGERSDSDMIRTGAEYALVELIFQVTDEKQKDMIRNMDIPMEEDGMILFQRKLMPGKSICKICGENVTTKMAKDVAAILIDIHGQNEHHSLLSKKKHLEILDAFAGEKMKTVLGQLKGEYENYQEAVRELDELETDSRVQERDLALAQFEWEEIENARLKVDEDIALETLYRSMLNSKKTVTALGTVMELTDNGEGAGDLLGRAARELKVAAGFEPRVEELSSRLQDIDSLLADLNREIADTLNSLEFSENDFVQIEERLNVLNHLKTKYGNSVSAILEYQNKLSEKIERLTNVSLYFEKAQKRVKEKTERMEELCKQAYLFRVEAAKSLEAGLVNALEDLNFLSADFRIEIRRKDKFNAQGQDEVEFLISTNPGEPIKPLADVASGGELSRIMLAVKTVLAKQDDIQTLIFDEIDAGISGKTAWKVSEKLALLGNGHQVICITHLPQIAAMADYHYRIIKTTEENSTTTQINLLDREGSIRELARLLGGETITEAAIINAKEMKELAEKTKKQ